MNTIWLLDVDGVINTSKPGWGAAPHHGTAYAGGTGYTMRWAPALIERIKALRSTGLIDIRWCTTWCVYADQLERLWKLPPLGRAFTGEINGRTAAMAKLAAARQVLADGDRLVWTDDTEVPLFGPLCDELTANGQGVLIRPRSNRGLQPEHLDQIEAFARKEL